jgi:hypothetical protein
MLKNINVKHMVEAAGSRLALDVLWRVDAIGHVIYA